MSHPFLRRLLVIGSIAALAALPAAAQQAPITFDPTVCASFTDGSALSAECEAMIAAFPRPPAAEPIERDGFTLTYYSFWRVGPEAIPTFDGPNGNVSGEIAAGYNYVRAMDLSNPDWMQIEGGRWIRRSDARYAQPSEFMGVTITDGLEHNFAWVLDLSRIYVSAYPGGPRSQDNGRWIDRYERVNIFAEAIDADGWKWYMIGPNQWVEQRFMSVVHRIERPEGVSGHWVAVDLYEQTLVAYEDDTPVFATLISSGLPTHETNEGVFEVWARLPRDAMSGAAGAPGAYALQSVPWVMYFDGGISLHGTYWHNLFGYRQSHGCVNLTVSDAAWLFEWMQGASVVNAEGEPFNQVYVYSSGEYGVTATGL